MNARPQIEPSVERLVYIRAMLNELRTMAHAERSQLLTHLIEMAYIQASDEVDAKQAGNVGLRQSGNTAA